MKNSLSLLTLLSICAQSHCSPSQKPGPNRASCCKECSCCPCKSCDCKDCSCCPCKSCDCKDCSCCPCKSCDCKDCSCCPCKSCDCKDCSCTKKQLTNQEVKDLVKSAYGKVAESNGTCSCCPGSCAGGCCGGGSDLSKYLGYTDEELAAVPEANLGLGCGNPISLGTIKEGDVILDLGSGAGIDCLLAARKVGSTGKVIGVDMTDAMLKKARENATKYKATNVEFRKGDIEKLPVESNSVDIILSNCVINLAPDKLAVFKEAYRVLKPGGRMHVSDVILLKELSKKRKNDANLICGCIGGALLKSDYINKLNQAGFTVKVVGEDTEICKKWFNHNELPISSLKFIAYKK